MAMYDPLQLAAGLDLLVDELDRWIHAAREIIHAAEQAQRRTAEQANRSIQKARLIAEQSQRDSEQVEALNTDLLRLEHDVDDASERSRWFVDLGDSALGIANGAYTYWQSELHKAREWLKRAEMRLAKAIEAYQKAVILVQQCEHNVNVAHSRLNDCRSASNRNCSGPARDLDNAKQELRQAIEWLRLTEAEVEAAKLEVAAARARVAGCDQAVGFCDQALKQAGAALQTTYEAKAQTDQALAHVQSARKLWNKAQQCAQQEQAIANDVLREAVALERTIDETLMHLRNAINSGENAQRYAIDGRREIDYRGDQLRILAAQRVN